MFQMQLFVVRVRSVEKSAQNPEQFKTPQSNMTGPRISTRFAQTREQLRFDTAAPHNLLLSP
jgi:hypothetical protein